MPEIPVRCKIYPPWPRKPIDVPSEQLKLKDIQMAFIKLITIVGGAATTAFIPMP
jgi:hypothetical protein